MVRIGLGEAVVRVGLGEAVIDMLVMAKEKSSCPIRDSASSLDWNREAGVGFWINNRKKCIFHPSNIVKV